MRSLVNKKSIPDWHLFITQMETKWTKWYAMTSHGIAYRSAELLFGTHTINFNCFFDDFNCVFTQISCLSRVLGNGSLNLKNIQTVSLVFTIDKQSTNHKCFDTTLVILKSTRTPSSPGLSSTVTVWMMILRGRSI